MAFLFNAFAECAHSRDDDNVSHHRKREEASDMIYESFTVIPRMDSEDSIWYWKRKGLPVERSRAMIANVENLISAGKFFQSHTAIDSFRLRYKFDEVEIKIKFGNYKNWYTMHIRPGDVVVDNGDSVVDIYSREQFDLLYTIKEQS